MGIMSRVIRLCKADIHGVMDQIEDKGLVLAQCLRDMEEDMARDQAQANKICARLDQAITAGREKTEQIKAINEDLARALTKEKDDIARFLIRKLKTAEAHASKLEVRIKNLHLEKDALSKVLEEKKSVYERLRLQTDTFMSARKNKDLYNPPGSDDPAGLSEEEVEWELEKRKEALS